MSLKTRSLNLAQNETVTLNVQGHIGIEVSHPAKIEINHTLYYIGYPEEYLQTEAEKQRPRIVRSSSYLIEFLEGRISTIKALEPISILLTYNEEEE